MNKHRVFACMLFLAATAVRADVFQLSTGAVVEGDLVEEKAEKVQIMLGGGAVTLSKSDIRDRKRGPTTLQAYEAEKKNRPDTAAGEFELGAWCDRNGLADEGEQHFRAAVVRDPTLSAAYRALGYAPVGDAWLLARPAVRSPATQPGAAEAKQPLLQEVAAGWRRRLHIIRRTCFDWDAARTAAVREQKLNEGRDQILAIRDPLAIVPMVRALSAGSPATRQVLAGALGRFSQDEATLNLMAISLLDPDGAVRNAAANELLRRKDSRIEAQLRQALKSGDDELVRRAAAALGTMKARSAVPDLIAQLASAGAAPTTARERYLAVLARAFAGPTVLELSGRKWQHTPVIAVMDASISSRPSVATRPARGPVAAQRVEVRDALTAITGQDLGFDAQAWRRWEKENPPAASNAPRP